MNRIRTIAIGAALTALAGMPSAVLAQTEELEVTMEVIDDLEGIEDIVRMRGPEPDERIEVDEGSEEDLFSGELEEASRLASQGFGGEEFAAQFEQEIEDDFEYDDRDEDMDETFEDERDDLEDGEDVDQDEFDEIDEPMDEPMDEMTQDQ